MVTVYWAAGSGIYDPGRFRTYCLRFDSSVPLISCTGNACICGGKPLRTARSNIMPIMEPAILGAAWLLIHEAPPAPFCPWHVWQLARKICSEGLYAATAAPERAAMAMTPP